MAITEIVFSGKMADSFKPMSRKTLALEAKLTELTISQDGRIQGVSPIKNRANGTLPANSGFKKFGNEGTFIIAPEGQDTVVVFGEI